MYVYLIESNQGYKIGFSKNPQNRLKQLQTSNSFKLILKDCYFSKYSTIIEKTIHRIYKDKSLNGEWFDLTSKDVNNFKKLCIKLENNINFIEKNKI